VRRLASTARHSARSRGAGRTRSNSRTIWWRWSGNMAGWGPWVAFLFVAIAFYLIWELMIAIRSWRSRYRGPWSRNSARAKSDQSRTAHLSIPSSHSSAWGTKVDSDAPVLSKQSDPSAVATEPRVAKSDADLLRMDGNRRRKQREHRLNLKSQGCDWFEDADELHAGKICWICRTCGAFAFTFNEDEPTTC
jgi:hypothetical protein